MNESNLLKHMTIGRMLEPTQLAPLLGFALAKTRQELERLSQNPNQMESPDLILLQNIWQSLGFTVFLNHPAGDELVFLYQGERAVNQTMLNVIQAIRDETLDIDLIKQAHDLDPGWLQRQPVELRDLVAMIRGMPWSNNPDWQRSDIWMLQSELERVEEDIDLGFLEAVE
jgi:hypothetical protein